MDVSCESLDELSSPNEDGLEVVGEAEEQEAEEDDEAEETDEGEDGMEEDDYSDDAGSEAKNKKLSAAVWLTAAKKLDSGKAQCLVCLKTFSMSDGSPSNVTKHVKVRHAGSERCKKLIALEIKRKEERKKKYEKKIKPKLTMKDFVMGKKLLSKREATKMNIAVEDFIVATNTSLSMVENPHFRRMLFAFHNG